MSPSRPAGPASDLRIAAWATGSHPAKTRHPRSGCAALGSLLLILALGVAGPAAAGTQKGGQGQHIDNIATLRSAELPAPVDSAPVTVIVRIPTPAKIELLEYAPGAPGNRPESIVRGVYGTGPNPADPLAPLALPAPAGAGPIDLTSPVPLLISSRFHQGDPVFIRVTDADQNLDPTVRETVLVTLSDDLTGDLEILQLTEDGPDTGVFLGYIPTLRTTVAARQQAASAGRPYDGRLQVIEQSMVTARYADPVNGGDAVSAAGLFDPLSLVFDSRSGQPVSGASITVFDVSTGQPATVLSDDGLSSFPATIVSGQTATDGAGRVHLFGPGEYRFPVLRTGNYRYEVAPPPKYTAPSVASDPDLQALPGGPFIILNPGSRGEAFALNPGPAERIDIPLDRASNKLWVQKTANKDRAGVGDFLSYQIAVSNLDPAGFATGVHAVDTLPVGFHFKSGSVQQNGAGVRDPAVSTDGRTLTFALGSIAPAATSTVTFVVQLGAGVAIGADATNVAGATSAAGTNSNVATATVHVGDDFFSTRSLIMGRVTVGDCIESEGVGTEGLAGARVLLEDGTFVVSDKRGLFHFEGVRKGLHVVQLDLDSLPEGFEAVSCTRNDRFAGRAFSQFVDLQGGTMWRADFHVRARPAQPKKLDLPPPVPVPAPLPVEPVAPRPEAKLTPGELVIALSHQVEGLTASFQVELRGSHAPLEGARLSIALPDGLTYAPGSSAIDGAAAPDPEIALRTLGFAIGSTGTTLADWQTTVTFRATASAESKAGTGLVAATLSGTGAASVQTLPAENLLEVKKEETGEPMKVVIRPHFASLDDKLSAPDKKALDKMAKSLEKVRPERITVIGYTDGLKIKGKATKKFADNAALSLARASSVGLYLLKDLHLPKEKLTLSGKGEADPIADNQTEKGRAENRRVELLVVGAVVGQRTVLTSVKAQSGEVHAETKAAAAALPEIPTGAAPALPAIPTGAAPALPEIPTSAAPALPAIPPSDARSSATQTSASSGAPAEVSPAISAASPDQAPAAPATAASPSAAPTPSAAPAPSAAPTSSAAPAPAAATAAPLAERDGLVSPSDGDLLADRVTAVQVRAPSYLTLVLSVDGKEVPASRIGYKREDPATGKTTYTFVGVDFGERGQHTLTVVGSDPFGNARLKDSATLTRTGEIATIRLVSAEGNIADSKTPVRMRFELLDRKGDVIHGATRLDLREGTLRPLKREGENLTLEDQAASRKVSIDKDGWVLFQPVSTSGSYRALLASGDTTVEAETWAQPKLRDWVLVGLAEGTAGYDTAKGNLQSLQAGDGNEQDLYANGRVAFYAKGQIQGKWLLTIAFDSGRPTPLAGNSLFQIIDPQTYYTLYGDSGQQGYDAASQRKLYIKLEREQFYALFGDYDTGLTVTELSRYSRRMNGAKTELQTRNLEVNAFGARTDQAYSRDEIPGDGTSGLYHLARPHITINSETITIVTRDRFHSEVTVSSQTMGRFTDYSIDYDSGTVFFREPITSRDPQLNPRFIVIEYETNALAGEDYTAGGRVGLKLLEQRLKAGATFIHEGQGDRQNDLYGADARLQLLPTTRLRGEFALTNSRQFGVSTRGDAFLTELQHTTHFFDAKIYLREQQGGFGLGQQPGTEAGTRKLGLDSAVRFDEALGITAQAYRQDAFTSGTERLLAEARFNYTTRPYGAYLGFLDTSDKLIDGSQHSSGQITMGGKLLTLKERLTVGLDYSQSIFGNGSADFPTRVALRGEYKLTQGVALLATQELTWGAGATTNNTRVGIRSLLWKGGSFSSSVERQLNENADRVFGNVGLRQSFQLSDSWKVDAGAERSQTISQNGSYQFNPNVPPSSGVNFPPATGGITPLGIQVTPLTSVPPGTSESFTAVSVGANYQIKSLVWDSRAELRVATSETKWALLTGMVSELSSGWAWSGRAQVLGANDLGGVFNRSGNLRLGLVHRPAHTNWILLNRLDYLLDRHAGTLADDDSWRLVDNLVVNYRPEKKLQLSFGYGGKFVHEVITSATYQGYTDQGSLEARYDLTEQWDVGVRASVLHSWSGQLAAGGSDAFSFGPSVGFSPVDNVWLGLGFNVAGYHDRDFSAANYTDSGPYLRMRFKFDQESVKDAAGWLNKQ